MKRLILFDIDGTLANTEHRLRFVKTKPKNWPAFARASINDNVIEPVRYLMDLIATDPNSTILLASGRSEVDKEVTEKWLDKNNINSYKKLYMRKKEDFRHDGIVKSEILDQIIEDWGKKPDAVFDDRPSVVDMWKERGVFVFSVYQGTEDF